MPCWIWRIQDSAQDDVRVIEQVAGMPGRVSGERTTGQASPGGLHDHVHRAVLMTPEGEWGSLGMYASKMRCSA